MGNRFNINDDLLIKHNKNTALLLNNETFNDYLERLMRIATSIFEWVNIPDSMDGDYLEEVLYYYGMAAIVNDPTYGLINTKVSSAGYVNIYGLPTSVICYSFEYNKQLKVWTGLENFNNENSCILVMNNRRRIPTYTTMQLFAYRLYEAEQTAFINVNAQKTPILLLCEEKQRQTITNLYAQYKGNAPVIFGDKDILKLDDIKAINTSANFIANDIIKYKQHIWNEVLTFLGINNIQVEKAERLITAEASSNNELINMNLQVGLKMRQKACDQLNKMLGITDEEKKIRVRVRSDLYNIIKREESGVSDYIDNKNIDYYNKDVVEEEI